MLVDFLYFRTSKIYHLAAGNHSTPEYTKNLSKCLKFSLAYQKMGYPADFRGFVEDLPEH